MRERLESLDPYRFEELIKDLLEAMDYEDVQVTKQSGDKGVDVIAKFQFGITDVCPMGWMLKKLGVPESKVACSR